MKIYEYNQPCNTETGTSTYKALTINPRGKLLGDFNLPDNCEIKKIPDQWNDMDVYEIKTPLGTYMLRDLVSGLLERIIK